ncbi:Rer1-like Golgi ER retention protein [Hamiltosporidium tvaerminnensis]|uniref:Protein RER1 n=2 Tax=Hamiltosporidium TaxID=1176354 RepID=A0A4Q9LLF9_9MICR|nr:retention in endoplasmic reticulum protein 1 [Hamiltosporidium tvaerminnensis]TBU00995.1 Rer1-like Golgi ER retention protein [Hamiltosporidium tvaerminnensis]TBU05050.1 hypothetical protein CWI36_0681p0030 [Hamiltosporidium magnivora]TBU08917.1 Rer1-like Golgi ER retention protein [Hamiltosporidium magnivora]TBU11343.1 Rer1-like Golgi ER retention protein [Hamiltosporidium tvaerminnensis]
MNIAILKTYFDRIVPMKRERWTFFGIVLFLFVLRIAIKRTHYLITYCLAIYLLHGLIGFCTPKEENIPDPFDNFEDDVYIPQTIDDDFKPFMRRLPEYSFWLMSIRLVMLALMGTFFGFLDIPVYAPILVVYFIVISFLTARNLHRHMKKYKYDPFRSFKEVYNKK